MSMHLHNWMKNIGDDTSVKDINIPGTHDSATKYCQFSLISSCQNKSIKEQLEIGVRAFDIRVDKNTLVHSFCKCRASLLGSVLTLDDVIGDIFSFLNENPSEIVLMFFKMDNGESSLECFRLLYENFIKTNPDKWYLENKIPALGEVRGKIVLLSRTEYDTEKAGIDFNAMPYQGGTKETKWEDFSPNGEDTVTVQDRYMLLWYKKWKKAVKPLLDESEKLKGNMILNFLSDAGIPCMPRFVSKYINHKFLSYNLKKGNHYGLIMFDFVNKKLTEKVINSNK